MLAVLMLGAVLRFYGLDNQSLWYDELASWQQSNYGSLSAVVEQGVRPDVHPPGYQILLYFVERYVGDSEVALRLLSAVSGVLSLLVMFLLGRSLYSYKEGLIAAASMAVLYTPIYFSQEARSYSTLLLFTLLATYFWVPILRRLNEGVRPSLYAVLGYIVAAVASSYLHYFGLFLIGLQGLGTALFLVRRRDASILYAFLIYLPVLLAYLPWAPSMWEDLNRGPIWIEPPRSTEFVYYLGFLFNNSRLLLLVVGILYLLFLLRNVRELWRKREHGGPRDVMPFSTTLVVLWLVVPFAVVYVKSVLSDPILTDKNLIVSLPAAYLLLSRSVTRLPIGTAGQAVVAVSLVALFASHTIFGTSYYSEPHKERFREAVGYIVEHDHLYENSLIVGCAWDGWNPEHFSRLEYFDYYLEKDGSSRRVEVAGCEEKDIPSVADAIKDHRYVWYIHAHNEPPPAEEFTGFLKRTLTTVSHEEFRHEGFAGDKDLVGAEVWLFEART